MQEIIYDPKTGLHYKLMGDYYIPLVKAPEPPNIGIWGQPRGACGLFCHRVCPKDHD